ncbi:ecto-ADP-ribosyltransferase 4 isoform X2 [Haplochromis burtoni]|uniref:NAD(P)(+)--arginine ADP-ribosyltransferase n=2 Tax=Haplochromis burtoni TaxID=8153 RepID=A0A3Q2WMM0_HAPBU|nr:ecto-ADP-ribosyltransferase 4 isoform X2 [Haplochromis burtoni]XP_014195473.1 ecto-ADP-ribosyltransferase 4 isoform X2 [Haplochromis burtoni]XP_042084451.1 ecto-ADP-ribosyltransferase 4 isoform X2 [Haplochromis burtoni]
MGCRSKVLLAAIIFMLVCYKVAAKDTRLLDVQKTTDVVDDQYKGCREEAMKKFIESDVLKKELSNSEGFQKAWNKSNECSKQIPGGRKEHTAALSVYLKGDQPFILTLNKAIETMGGNVNIYKKRFQFKSLHFLLMDSMRLLKPKECKNFYVFRDGQNKPQKGSTVRFTSFTLAYSNYEELKRLEDVNESTILNLTSCFFVNLKDYVCGQGQDEILLSPAEVFTVEQVETKTTSDGDEYLEIVLNHSGLNSSHNCYIFSRSPPAAVSTLWLVSVLAASSLFSLTA